MLTKFENIIWEGEPSLVMLENVLFGHTVNYMPAEKFSVAEGLMKEVEVALRRLSVSFLSVRAETTTALLIGSATGLGTLTTEVPLSWDPILELPVIPGSTLKGVARAWLEDYLDNAVGEARGVGDIFGSKDVVSRLTFYDAYPIAAEKSLLTLDIVNPHYNPVTNPDLKIELDVQPKPVKHVAVAPGVTFHIVVAATPSTCHKVIGLYKILREKVDEAGKPSSHTRDYAALALLTSASLAHGVGGRTLKGYGKLRVTRAELHLAGDSI